MSEEEGIRTDEATTEDVAAEVKVEIKPKKALFKDKLTVTSNANAMSGSCNRCGERMHNVESTNGKYKCSSCGFDN